MKQDSSISFPLGLTFKIWGETTSPVALQISLPSQSKYFYLQGDKISSFQNLPASGIPLFQYLRKLGLLSSGLILAFLRAHLPSNSQIAQKLIREGKVDQTVANQALYTIQQKVAARPQTTAYLGTYLLEQNLITPEELQQFLAHQKKNATSFSHSLSQSGKFSPEEIRVLLESMPPENLSLPRLEEIVFHGRKFSREILLEVVKESILEGLEIRDVLLSSGIANLEEAETLSHLLHGKMEKPPSVPRLGELLTAQGKVTREEVDGALEEQKQTNQYLGEILLAKGYISTEDLQEGLEKIGELEKAASIPDNLVTLLAKQKHLLPQDCSSMWSHWEISPAKAARFFVDQGWLSLASLEDLFQTILKDELFSLMVYPELPVESQNTSPPPSFTTEFGITVDRDTLFSKIYPTLPSPEKKRLWSMGLDEIYHSISPPADLGEGTFQANLYASIDGVTSLRKILFQKNTTLEIAYPLLAKWEGEGHIARYSEEELFQAGEDALEKGDYNPSLAFFESLSRGILYPEKSRKKIPLILKKKKKKKMIFVMATALVLLFLGGGGLFYAFVQGTATSQGPKKIKLTAGQKKLLQQARTLIKQGKPKKAFLITQKLLAQKVEIPGLGLPFLVRSQPVGASVYLKNKLLGTTSKGGFIGLYLPQSRVKLRIEKRGYLPKEKDFDGNQWIEADFSLALKPLWKRPNSFRTDSQPLGMAGKFFLASRDGVVSCVDRQGGLVWKKKVARFGDFLTSPVGAKDRIYIANVRGQVVALSAERGEILWKTSLFGALSQRPPRLFSYNEKTYLAVACENKLYLLDCEKGQKKLLFSARHLLRPTPLWVAPYLYAGGLDNYLYAYHLPSRKILWKREFPGDLTLPVLQRGNYLYAISAQQLYKIQRSSGEIEKRVALKSSVDRPSFWVEDQLCIVHPEEVSFWDPNSLEEKKHPSFRTQSPVLQQGGYLCWMNKGICNLFDLSTSRIVWKEKLPFFSLHAFLVDGERLVLLSKEGAWLAYPIKKP